jgi:site-specific DNA recombinase
MVYADLAGYEAEEKDLIRERNRYLRDAGHEEVNAATLRTDWEGNKLTLAEKRGYVEKVLSAVIVGPMVTRGRVDDRITPVPRDPAHRI